MRRHHPITAFAATLLAAGLALAGCGDPGDGASDDRKKEAAAAPQGGAADADAKRQGGGKDGGRGADGRSLGEGERPGRPVRGPKQVVHTATLTVRTKDVAGALSRARAAVDRAGGYAGDEATDQDPDGRRRSRVELKVPPAAYQDLLDELGRLGRLVERRVTVKDVTDRMVDVESRVASQKASVARVRELMDRATSLSDVVTLEGELSTRQADLEALQAQLAALKEQTAMATVTLNLHAPDAEAADGGDDEPGFGDALSGGWHAFTTAVRWAAVACGAVSPFAVAAALVVLVVRLVRRRPLTPARWRASRPGVGRPREPEATEPAATTKPARGTEPAGTGSEAGDGAGPGVGPAAH
ncbi:DUF4349 domain-containing protein [Streptomyces sp. LX-29]|uniref:DUF4349 domain-containing protein n=1 Tax=Streptomyces sp. LX-29 TaxID=2900152 RepID=UPI00240E7498|nr:DUF4349 domain-containing protein [Streptomyces sp. LX-29]WFB06924.1 DUF4349 domain-containing protein [Streptomyces sp. LX-29]